jgi:hypothetical protein
MKPLQPGRKVWTLNDETHAGFILLEWRVLHATAAGYVLRVPTARETDQFKYFPRCAVLDAQQAKEYRREAAAADPKQGDLVLVIDRFRQKPEQGIVMSTSRLTAEVLMTDGTKSRRQDGSPFCHCNKRDLVVIERPEAAPAAV